MLSLAAIVLTCLPLAAVGRTTLGLPSPHATVRRSIYHAADDKLLPPGYDDAAEKLFRNQFKLATDNVYAGKVTDVSVMGSHFQVTDDAPFGFWGNFNKPDGVPTWEPDLFRRYFEYVTPKTTLVDFGTWIGPTILFGATRAKRVYGIEGDPVAYASALANVQLNADALKNIHLQPGCVATSEERRTMKSAAAGNSCSGLGDVACGTAAVEWKVQCYTLPHLFTTWNIDVGPLTFIKIDVESYECELLPSLASWLTAAPVKPTLHVAMHSQIARCSAEQYGKIDALIQTYGYVFCNGARNKHEFKVGTACDSGELVLSDVLPSVAK
jgi:FkbM family methyltransferase